MSHERSFSATISFLEKVAPREVKDEYCLLKLHYKSEDKKEAHLGSYMSYLPDSLRLPKTSRWYFRMNCSFSSVLFQLVCFFNLIMFVSKYVLFIYNFLLVCIFMCVKK